MECESEFENEEITKGLIISEIRDYVVTPYIDKFSGESSIKVSVAEFLKGQEMICKLKGFFDKESSQDLPDEIKILLP